MKSTRNANGELQHSCYCISVKWRRSLLLQFIFCFLGFSCFFCFFFINFCMYFIFLFLFCMWGEIACLFFSESPNATDWLILLVVYWLFVWLFVFLRFSFILFMISIPKHVFLPFICFSTLFKCDLRLYVVSFHSQFWYRCK